MTPRHVPPLAAVTGLALLAAACASASVATRPLPAYAGEDRSVLVADLGTPKAERSDADGRTVLVYDVAMGPDSDPRAQLVLPQCRAAGYDHPDDPDRPRASPCREPERYPEVRRPDHLVCEVSFTLDGDTVTGRPAVTPGSCHRAGQREPAPDPWDENRGTAGD